MDTITISVDDDFEAKFRKAARVVFGAGKGSLGKAASRALGEWSDRELTGSEAKMLSLLQKGFKMGRMKYKSREEIHDVLPRL